VTVAHTDTPVTVTSDQARQLAIHELSKPEYHQVPSSPTPSPLPSTAIPSPPPAHTTSSSHVPTIVLIVLAIIVLVIALVLFLRWLGRPRDAKKRKSGKDSQSAAARAADEVLTGAALHRRNAELAAAAQDWAEAIRERFRAVIATLDERGLLPERADRTADEAARDAGVILPAHSAVLAAAARAFDEVEYGEYVGTPDAYAVISNVDELVRTEQPGTLLLPTAIAPTIPGGIASGPQ
jgi:type II secretory pathway pseudopilin PulG